MPVLAAALSSRLKSRASLLLERLAFAIRSACSNAQRRSHRGWDTAPRHLRHDRDRIFGDDFTRRGEAMGIREVRAASVALAMSPRGPRDRHHLPRAPGPRDRLPCSRSVPAHEIVRALLSRIQDEPLAGQAHAGTAARAPGGTRTRRCHTASWRSSAPVPAARSVNFAGFHPHP